MYFVVVAVIFTIKICQIIEKIYDGQANERAYFERPYCRSDTALRTRPCRCVLIRIDRIVLTFLTMICIKSTLLDVIFNVLFSSVRPFGLFLDKSIY